MNFETIHICCICVPDLKKRVAEAELKQYELKCKSECFDQLMEMSTKQTHLSMPSPAPSDWSEQSTFGEEIGESEHSESASHSDERGAKTGGKRSRKPARTVRIPPEEVNTDEYADENENIANASESNGECDLTTVKRKVSKKPLRKRVKYSEDEDYVGGDDDDDD
jgi:hypothetical protein